MAITGTGRPGPVRDEALTALAADLHGPLLRPHDDGYDTARLVWNVDVDRLRLLEARYDPGNLFRLDPNTTPVAPPPRQAPAQAGRCAPPPRPGRKSG